MDTIVAISTALGQGAISIIRLSGDDAISIVSKVFRGKDLMKVDSHTINYGKIYDGDEYVDEVMVSVLKAPKTYTREDVVEINCHGSIFLANKILELMVDNGARIAEPGEFTKRAFLNGRIDLTQAEAVMDVINAQTDYSLKCANIALRGDVRDMIIALREKLINCIAKIEVNTRPFRKYSRIALSLTLTSMLLIFVTRSKKRLSIVFCSLTRYDRFDIPAYLNMDSVNIITQSNNFVNILS